MSAIGGDGGNRRALESGRGFPAQPVARAVEKVSQALGKLGAATAPARAPSADTMERSLGFGPFGAAPRVPTPPAGARALEGLPETWLTIWARARELAPGLTDSVVSMGRAESVVAALREGLARIGEGQGLWARARTAAGEDAIGRIAARFLALRERLGSGLEAAAQPRSVGRSSSLAAVVRGLRGEAASMRQHIAWARELVPDVELGVVGVARSALQRAEGEMRTAEYGLQAYATQQELLAPLQGAGPGRISEEELNRIGTGITEAPPPQGFWNIGTVGAGMDPAFSCDSYCQAAAEAVNRAIGDSTSVRPLEGAELAAAIRDMGVPLEKVDPNQLAAALSYVNTGASGAVAEFGRGAPQTLQEQRERLHSALRQFRCLAEHGPAQMDRSTAINMMWSAARIPGHAFEKMSDAEVLAAAQQTAAYCNTPGSHEYKVGRHTVKLTIGEGNTVLSTSTRAPSAWSKVGRIAKVALTVASFIPGPVGLVARCVQAGIALVNAVRNGGSFLDLVAAGASFVGAGAGAVGRIARASSTVVRTASNVARVANSVSGAVRGVQGVQRGGLGGVISGAAGIANSVAGAIPGGGAAGHLSTVRRVLGEVGAGVGAAEAYIHANRAVGDAREALEQARASGDIQQIRQAERQLADAERGKRSAVLGGLATGGQIAGRTLSRNSAGQSEARAGQVPAQGRSAFQVGAEIFSRGMSTARGLNDGDIVSAGVDALGGLAAARQGTQPLRQEMVLGPDGRPIPLIDENGNRVPGRVQTRNDFSFLTQASSVLDGMNDWRGAERGESQAREAVEHAEQALGLARSSGNPEAIKEAEDGLRQARQGLVQADLTSTLALDNAAERFTGSVETFQNSRAADAYRGEQQYEQGLIEKTRKRTGDLAVDMSTILRRPDATPTEKEWAVDQLLALAQADGVYEQALQTGDPALIRQARVALEGAQEEISRLPPPLARVASLGVPDVPRVSVIGQRETERADPGPGATFYAGPVEDFGVMAEKFAGGYEPRDPSTGLFLSPEQLQELAKSQQTRAQRAGGNKEWAESRLGRLDELLGEGFGQYAEISIQESAFRDGRLDSSRILEALEARVGQYAALEVPQLRDAIGEALRDAKPGDVLDVSELYSIAYQSSRARALSVAESIGEPGSIRYWSALIGQADYAPADLVDEARFAVVGQTTDALALALGAYAVGRGAAQVGRAFLRDHFASPPSGVMRSPVNRGVGTGNPLGYVADVSRDYRLRALTRQVAGEVDAAIEVRDSAALMRFGATPAEADWAIRGAARFRGTIIDLATKQRAADTFGRALNYTGRGRYGPDIWNPVTGRSWDITTSAAWRRHVLKYVINPKAGRPVFRSIKPLLTK